MTITSPYDPVTGVPLESVAEAAGLPSPAAADRPRPKRRDALIMAMATLLGLWFGLGAPSVSPVTPPGPDPSAVSVAAGPATVAPADPPAVDPVDPVDQEPGRGDRAGQDAGDGRGGGDRR